MIFNLIVVITSLVGAFVHLFCSSWFIKKNRDKLNQLISIQFILIFISLFFNALSLFFANPFLDSFLNIVHYAAAFSLPMFYLFFPFVSQPKSNLNIKSTAIVIFSVLTMLFTFDFFHPILTYKDVSTPHPSELFTPFGQVFSLVLYLVGFLFSIPFLAKQIFVSLPYQRKTFFLLFIYSNITCGGVFLYAALRNNPYIYSYYPFAMTLLPVTFLVLKKRELFTNLNGYSIDQILDLSTSATFITDRQLVLNYYNKTAEKLFHFTYFNIGKSLLDTLPQEFNDKLKLFIKGDVAMLKNNVPANEFSTSFSLSGDFPWKAVHLKCKLPESTSHQILFEIIKLESNSNEIEKELLFTKEKLATYEKEKTQPVSQIDKLISEADPSLTVREEEICKKILEGLSHDAIANQLLISERTVRVHAISIYRKFKVTSKTDLFAKLVQKG